MNTLNSDRTIPDDVHTLAGAYALHALQDQEAAAFESHLLRCPSCQAELAEFRATAAILAAAAASPAPPQLKARVMTAVSRTRQQPPPVPPVAEQGPASRHRATLARIRPARRLLAAAAAVVLLAAGIGAVQTYRLQQAADQREQVAAVVAAPDARSVNGAVAGGGRVTLVVSEREQASVVILDKLSPAPANRTYQMWLLHDRTATSAGTVDITASERTTRILPTPAGSHPDGFGLTVEPHGGSRTPTPPVLVQLPLR